MPDPAGSFDVAAHFALDQVGDDEFRSAAAPERPFGGIFGGQPLALALRAAGATVTSDRFPHSLHAYFLRPGQGAKPMNLQVARDTDGRSFSARRVTVSQEGAVIFTMSASFHVTEEGPDTHLPTMPPDVAEPDSLPATPTPFGSGSPVEVRNVKNRFGEDGMATQAWGRASGPLPEDPLLHTCVLVHFSDLYTGLPAMPDSYDRGGPSLDHAFWFHRPANLDDWVLMDLAPLSTGRGRGLYTGAFYDRRGVLVASLAQEVLYSTSRPARQFPPPGISADEFKAFAEQLGMRTSTDT